MKQWKKYTLLAGSLFLLLLPKKIVHACGFWASPGEYRFWLLQPDLTNQPDLTPFFFASTYLYKQDPAPLPDPSVQANIREWHRYIHRAATAADIDSLLNETDPQDFFEQGKQIAQHNSFLRYLLRPENKDLYSYFVLSKKVEQIAAGPDPWEENRFPLADINQVIGEARALQQKTHSPFIRLRIAYQLIRLYGYNWQTDSVAREYRTSIAPVRSESWIKTAALYQRAIHSDSTEYEYLLSKVFDRGGYNRSNCLIRFQQAQLQEALRHARNSHERTVLYTMHTLNNPGKCLSSIRAIYQAEPAYHEIPFLLLREINKVEDWLVTNKVTGFRPAVYHGVYSWYGDDDMAINYRADKAYAHALNRLIEQIIRDGKNKEISLLHLFSAHISMLNGDYGVARQHLEMARKNNRPPANVQFQIKVNSFLLDLQTAGGFSASAEHQLMNILQTPAVRSGVYDHDLMKDQLILYTARKLISKGARAKGFLLLGKTRRTLGMLGGTGQLKSVYQVLEEQAVPPDYDAMIRILDRKKKTRFEKFVTEGNLRSPSDYYWTDTATAKWNRNKLLDCQATRYIRNNDLYAAMGTLRQIPDSFWKQESYAMYIKGDPFFLDVNFGHRVTANDKKSYNKREVVARMMQLQELSIHGGSKAAQADFFLANAWYNLSYYGKDWLIMKQWWSYRELYDNELQRTPFNDVYLGCTRAKQFYLSAMKKTNDKRLATLCCFMAGKCHNNFLEYLWAVRNKRHANAEEFKSPPNPYRFLLEKKGVEERYYNEMVAECGVYYDYVRAYNH